MRPSTRIEAWLLLVLVFAIAGTAVVLVRQADEEVPSAPPLRAAHDLVATPQTVALAGVAPLPAPLAPVRKPRRSARRARAEAPAAPAAPAVPTPQPQVPAPSVPAAPAPAAPPPAAPAPAAPAPAPTPAPTFDDSGSGPEFDNSGAGP